MRPFYAALLPLPLHAPLWRSGPHLHRRRNFSRSPRGERRDPPQHTAVPRSTRSDRAVPLSLWLSLFASLRAALRELLSIRDARAPVEQVGRSLPGSLEERTNQQCCSSSQEPSSGFPFFLPCPFPAPQALKKYGPAHRGRGIACTVLERTPSAGAGRHPPPRRGSAAGTLLAPQAEIF